ncbi:hypothetical protein Y600_6097 [Burkholderia pseudomallei MSHR3709]|nr:hypothetical protein Y600_6097 [Burkholderia pseudomallei MSHR3709]
MRLCTGPNAAATAVASSSENSRRQPSGVSPNTTRTNSRAFACMCASSLARVNFSRTAVSSSPSVTPAMSRSASIQNMRSPTVGSRTAIFSPFHSGTFINSYRQPVSGFSTAARRLVTPWFSFSMLISYLRSGSYAAGGGTIFGEPLTRTLYVVEISPLTDAAHVY